MIGTISVKSSCYSYLIHGVDNMKSFWTTFNELHHIAFWKCKPTYRGKRLIYGTIHSMDHHSWRLKYTCRFSSWECTVYPKNYAHGFCFAVLCCGYTLTDFPISIRLTSLALWQSNDCPSASKATLMNMDKYFMWIHYCNSDTSQSHGNELFRVT